MTDPVLCDVPGCDEAWIFVEHRDRVAIRRRCHHHWFEGLRLAEAESLAIVRPVDPRKS